MVRAIFAVARFFGRMMVMLAVGALVEFLWRLYSPATAATWWANALMRVATWAVLIRYLFKIPVERLLWRNRRAAAGAAVVAVAIFAAGCGYDPHAQESAIVREIESAGSGNISNYSVIGLDEWFAHRPQFARQIALECETVRRTAGANWATSAEGSACLSAARVAPEPPAVADTRSF